jgi:hypothetical protein
MNPMLLYDETRIWKLYEKKRKQAATLLSSLFGGHVPNLGTLHGWVFEQTIQYCLRKELHAGGIAADIREQIPLVGRAKADFGIECFAVEIKLAGLFGLGDAERYRRYRQAAEGKGFEYLFVSTTESVVAYRTAIVKALGEENVFFLDEPKDWGRFVARIAAGCKSLHRQRKRQ